MDDKRAVDWWKVCNHPVVQGLHRIITVIAAPLAIGMLYWAASTFDNMRLSIDRLQTTVALQIQTLKDSDVQIVRRIERLEDHR